jgi:hypothetical protein
MTSLELVLIPFVIASEAKQSIERQSKYGLLRRLASLRKRFAFVAGNDEWREPTPACSPASGRQTA